MKLFKIILIIICFVPSLLFSQTDYEELLKTANKRIKLNGFYIKTVDLFTQCIEIKPRDYRPYYGRASVYYKMEKFDLALSDLDRSIELNPRHLDSYYKSIEILNLTGNTSKARALVSISESIESGKETELLQFMQPELVTKINDIASVNYEKWLLKDQFETLEMHQQRTSDTNRTYAWKRFQNEAINELAQFESELHRLDFQNYDADNELFALDYGIFGVISVYVPLSEARTFNNAIPSMKIENLECDITEEKEIELLSMSLTYNGISKRFVSDENAGYYKPVNSTIQFRDVNQTDIMDVGKTMQNDRRLALIIGNGEYQFGGTLLNPVNDAISMKVALETLGFEVIKHENLNMIDMHRAIDDFGVKLRNYGVGLFFYAGHGIQVNGENYLIPVDANLNTENDVLYNCVNTGRLLAKMEDARNNTNIIILDACRDNPFERSWSRSSRGKGLAFMNAPAGSLIAYATSPGSTASDGGGINGLYTAAILKFIDLPNQSILQMFQEVRRYVRDQSKGQQTPWETTSLEGDFFLNVSK